MANIVEITVRTKDDVTSSLKNIESKAKVSGAASGAGFSAGFSRSIGNGTFGSVFGKGGGSVVSDAQKTGQNVGMGLGRGILQKFNTTLGSGLLSGLFGTSGGSKLFGSAGNTVVQDATKQGQSIAQGLGKGLNDGFADTENKVSGVLSGLFSSGGSTESDAESQGSDIGRSFTKGLSEGFSKAGSSVDNILSGLFGGSGSGPDESAGEEAGKDAGIGFLSGFRNVLNSGKGDISKTLGGLLSGGGSSGGSGGGMDAAKDALNSGGVAGGALPGVAGVSGFAATMTGLGGVLVAVLPAITSVVSGLGVLGGGFAILEASNKKFAADMSSTMATIKQVFEAAAAPLAKPMEQAAAQIAGYFKQLEPEFKAIFGDSAQLIQPMVKGFEALVGGALPGFLAMIKDAGPVFATLSGSFADLGKSLGEMFGDFAKAEGPSAVVLKSLLDLVNTLFPILGKLGEIFATAVAPAVAAFGAALDKVLPAIEPLLGIIAQLAGAALTDLAGILGSVGTLLVDLAPSFTLLAKAAGQVFTALENDGVFASISNAVESLAAPLATLINALVKGLAPTLPGIITGFSDIAEVLTGGATIALTAVAEALTAVIKAIPPGVMTVLVDGFVGVVAAVKAWSIAQAVLNVLLDANPIGLLALALAAVAVGFYTAWEKSAGFRDVIKDIGKVVLQMGIMTLQGLQEITNGFDTFVGALLDGAAKAFGWVPGLGPKLKAAAAGFDGFKTSTNAAYDAMIKKLQDWQNGLNASSKTASATSKAISDDFTRQAKAASDAKGDIDNLDVAIGTNGSTSNQAKTARQKLITDLENAGVKASTAKADVDDYSAAVAKNGTESSQAQSARAKLIKDILNASNNAVQGKKDLAGLTTAVKDHGTTSNAYKSARAKLITDLENAGLSAKAATSLVNSLTKAIGKVPTSKKINLYATAHGSGKVVYRESFPGGSLQGALLYGAAGGVVPDARPSGGSRMVPGYAPGQDSQWARVSPGEAILVPEAARALGYGNILGLNKSHGRGRRSTGLAFASGGIVGDPGLVSDQMGSVADGYMKRVTSASGSKMWALLKEKVNEAKSLQAFVNVTGSGVTRWASTVKQALSMEGLSQGLTPNVLYQMQTESGGNPNAINNWDSNAAAGDPSRGLMQVIMSTFDAYHWPGTSGDIYNPLANIAAAINYARHVYGPNLANQYGGLGSGHGYASGGATSAGWATVGERGRELVKLPGGSTVVPNGTTNQMLAQGGGMHITLELGSSFKQAGLSQQQLEDIRYTVRVLGGGDAQRALGAA